MGTPAHKNHTKEFRQLSFHDQARSINASIANLQKSIQYHVKNAEDSEAARKKTLAQINRMLGRLIDYTLLFLIAISLGCDGIGGISNPETSAHSFLEEQLDNYIAGQKVNEFLYADIRILCHASSLLDYDIKTFKRDSSLTEADFHKEGDWYRATVNLTLEQVSGSGLIKKRQYCVYRETSRDPWEVTIAVP